MTVGASEAIDIALRAMIGPGDEVLVPEPSYVSYSPSVIFAGGTPVGIETRAEDEFRLTPEQLKAMSVDEINAALREGLWAESPSLSRPVSVKNRDGLLSDAPDLRVLTLEIGSAGNTYGEACATVEPLGEAIAAVLEKYS